MTPPSEMFVGRRWEGKYYLLTYLPGGKRETRATEGELREKEKRTYFPRILMKRERGKKEELTKFPLNRDLETALKGRVDGTRRLIDK